jgi:hypothetical protein
MIERPREHIYSYRLTYRGESQGQWAAIDQSQCSDSIRLYQPNASRPSMQRDTEHVLHSLLHWQHKSWEPASARPSACSHSENSPLAKPWAQLQTDATVCVLAHRLKLTGSVVAEHDKQPLLNLAHLSVDTI